MRVYILLLILFLTSTLTYGQEDLELLEEYFLNSGSEFLEESSEVYDDIMEMEDFDEAKAIEKISDKYNWLEKTAAVNKVISKESSPEKNIQLYIKKGEKALIKRDYDNAITNFDRALKYAKNNLPNRNKHPQFSKIERAIGTAYEGKKNYDEALVFYNKSILSNYRQATRSGVGTSLEDIIAPQDIFPSLERRASVLRKLYNEKKEWKYLLDALKEYENIVELLALVRKKYDTENLKLNISNRSRKFSESGIEVALELYRFAGNELYLNKAFELAERGKSTILLDALMSSLSKETALVPNQLIRKEKELKTEIAYYEGLLKSTHEEALDDMDKWNIELFKLQESLLELEEAIQKRYPLSNEWEYLTESVDLSEIKETMSIENSIMINYFFGEHSIYIFGVNDKRCFVTSLPNSNLILDEIKGLRASMVSTSVDNQPKKAFLHFIKHGRELYKLLLDEILKTMFVKQDKLIILPDNYLWLFPFEVLLSRKPIGQSVDYGTANLDYLLEDYRITYANSAGVYFQNRLNEITTVRYGGFAPNFRHQLKCSGNLLYPLKHNQKEVQIANDALSGEIFLDKAATKEHFMQNYEKYSILHFATHTCLDVKSPQNSKIYFSDSTLSTNEIYHLKMNADMVVLSACETGIGKLEKGEGMMSLSRAFAYAGCPSLTMSLWAVSDQSTTQLMQYYYEFLNQAMNKSAALRAAKLKYIEEQDVSKQHPYYWAAFLHLGNDQSITEKKQSSLLWWGLGLVLILFLLMKLKK